MRYCQFGVSPVNHSDSDSDSDNDNPNTYQNPANADFPPLCLNLHHVTVVPPGGGTLKFSVYIGEADFFWVKILNFHIFGGFSEKLVIFLR